MIDNAIDAVHRQTEKRLEARTELESGNLLVEIIHNGTGIPEDVRAHIFDPFFTTKPVDEGTGLGWTSYIGLWRSKVDSGWCRFRVESERGRTSFQVRLPI